MSSRGDGNIANQGQLQEDRNCWVCYATDADDTSAQWVRPCQCRGTTKWVHQLCLQRWVDEKQKGNMTERVRCPQCNAAYMIVFPPMGKLVVFLDAVDQLVYRTCPFVAAGIVVGSVYWTAVTYGALTIMQVAGPKEGLAVMEQADPLFLLIGLPTIPVMLVMGRLVRWEDTVLLFLRRNVPRFPLAKYFFPSFFNVATSRTVGALETPPMSDPVRLTRILCGALAFPSLAVLVGKLLYSRVNSNLQKTILGGLTYIALKGALKIYHKQKSFERQCSRRILDITEQIRSAEN